MKKAASNAKRYPLCEICQFPLSRKPTVSCLLRLCPNPRRTHKLCSGTQDKSCGYAIFQIAKKRKAPASPNDDAGAECLSINIRGQTYLQGNRITFKIDNGNFVSVIGVEVANGTVCIARICGVSKFNVIGYILKNK